MPFVLLALLGALVVVALTVTMWMLARRWL